MARMRVKRIESLIREETARFILTDLADPRLGFITVTRVECTSDLAYAKLFISIMGSESQQRTTLRALTDARTAIRMCVGQALKIRRVPEIDFALDTSVDKSIRMSELIREARASDPDGGEAAEAPAAGADQADGRDETTE